MKKVLLASACLFALAAPASGADLAARPYTKAPVAMASVYNWTGFYLGINGGYGWGRSNWNDLGTRTSVSGGLAGVTAGYNWQAMGSPWVFGLEGDIDWSDIKGSFVSATCPVD